ncbi:MAG: AAA family ATPase [Eubacteriales bacterium]|nr:AAA family ATPase [Eubacteriales bacterium]
MSKIPSEIIRIDLSDASYKGTNSCTEQLTYVNFFFGNNGTGKSTVAKAIQSGTGVTYAPGRGFGDYLPLVYNQAFIDGNFRNYRNMPGVFTLNAKNDAAQKLIDEKTAARGEARKAKTAATEQRDRKTAARTKLQKDFYKECWEREEAFRTEFEKTQDGKGKSKPFTEEIMRHAPKDTDIEELRRLYDSAYSDTAKRYSRFSSVEDTAVLDSLDGSDVLSLAIVNSATTELAEFLRDIGATQWMRQGHDAYTEHADGRCPYCRRKLDDDFEQTVIDSFDDRYQKNLARLDEFLTLYRKTANDLYMPLETFPSEVYPKIDIKPLSDKLVVLKAAIQSNVETIRGKQEEPAKVVTLTEIAPILKEIVKIISGFNALIDANNAVVDAGPKKRAECTELAFSLLAFRLKDIIAAYKKSDADLCTEITGFEGDITTHSEALEKINAELKAARSDTVETETAKDSINLMLRDSGMQGFSLEPKPGVDHVYEVRRPDGSIAENLSEGEKNFIAFLYFYHLVYGSESADGEARDKIVVIDDPVSSMDSGCLFIVSTLVRQMIEICRNNADNRNRTIEGNFIKQIFILTHNAYFHREVTYSYVLKYEYVSFYLIRKLDSKSSIKLSDDVNPKIPTERMNVNPVKNSYAALWDEYKEIKSAVPLMNVIRRILEYYFLQLCGYEGATLRKVILTDGKAKGNFKDENGNDDEEKFQLASAMLAYINASSVGMNDGMDYVEGCLNAAECRSIFEMIFTSMNQKQHYDMMMCTDNQNEGIVRGGD